MYEKMSKQSWLRPKQKKNYYYFYKMIKKILKKKSKQKMKPLKSSFWSLFKTIQKFSLFFVKLFKLNLSKNDDVKSIKRVKNYSSGNKTKVKEKNLKLLIA